MPKSDENSEDEEDKNKTHTEGPASLKISDESDMVACAETLRSTEKKNTASLNVSQSLSGIADTRMICGFCQTTNRSGSGRRARIALWCFSQ